MARKTVKRWEDHRITGIGRREARTAFYKFQLDFHLVHTVGLPEMDITHLCNASCHTL